MKNSTAEMKMAKKIVLISMSYKLVNKNNFSVYRIRFDSERILFTVKIMGGMIAKFLHFKLMQGQLCK